MEKTTLYLTPELRRRLKSAARKRGRPEAELVREALTGYLASTEPKGSSFIGIISDGTLDAANAKRWVRAEWEKDDKKKPRARAR